MTEFLEFLRASGVAAIAWRDVAMIGIACGLLWLAIVKRFEPLLLVPIAFGALVVNLPLNALSAPPTPESVGGLFHYLSSGLWVQVLVPLLFLGLGALTDFGPLLADPRTLLIGGAAQAGVFATLALAPALGFTPLESASIAMTAGVHGPAAIVLTGQVAPQLLGAVAVATYALIALLPVVQPPVMRLCTSDAERRVRMSPPGAVPRSLLVAFPVAMTIATGLLAPAAMPLIGLLMLGNLLRECGVTERLTRASQNELVNLISILLGLGVGATMRGDVFLRPETVEVFALGAAGVVVATAAGVLAAKLMARMPGRPLNPLIGAAGVAALPMAARVVNLVGQDADAQNDLLVPAMGPSAAGVIALGLAVGVLRILVG